MGQNSGAGQLARCRKTLKLSLAEGALALVVSVSVILYFGKPLLSLFNSDPQVIELGYIRLVMTMTAHSFALLYEVMAGYLRGFGISLVPAVLAMFGVCGVRILWIITAFPQAPTFRTILMAYPISLSATAVMIFFALLVYHPSRQKGASV